MHSVDTYPILHIRPRRGWLNDPNGMTRHQGRWHVFFQHNPLRAQWGQIQWGHVSSADLVSWTEHPIAFGPQPDGPDRYGCWSGSFLPGLDRPAVAYTGIVSEPEHSTVCVRYALDDDLQTWSEPVVVAHEPEGIGLRAMRDPYPFEWGGRRYALLGAGMSDGTPTVLLFSCDDPHQWRYEGIWLTGRNDIAATVAPADIWECPQLVRFGDTYVLVLSLQTEGRLEDVVYLVGHLEGDAAAAEPPRFVPHHGDKLDHGPDFYAPQVIEDGGEAPLLFGWVRQEDALDDAPDDALAGCLTLPRRIRLRQGRIEVSPDSRLEALLTGDAAVLDRQETKDREAQAQALDLPARAKVSIRAAGGAVVDLELQGQGGGHTLRIDEAGYEVWLDGEVAEIFQEGTIAATIRHPGTASWSIAGDLSRCVTGVQELALP